MKKLTLAAAVAAIALTPALADARQDAKHSAAAEQGAAPGHSYTVIDRDLDGKAIEYRTTTTTRHKQVDAEGNVDFTGQYSLIDGSTLSVEGKSAYLVADSGNRFFAPKSAYMTQRGQTFFVEDGQVLRLENPPETIYIDADAIVR
jgi:hypothetical protein